jgi:hypothetical protein
MKAPPNQRLNLTEVRAVDEFQVLNAIQDI